MIEPIIVITILVLLAWRIRRYIKKHRLNKRRDNQLLLDSPTSIKLGPFSGSYQYFKNPKSLILLCAFSIVSQAEVSLLTLSNWRIDDFNEETLMVAKTNLEPFESKSRAMLFFKLSRPHCFADQPLVMLKSKIAAFSDGDEVNAEMIVDKGKPQKIVLERHMGYPKNGYEVNWFILHNFSSFVDSANLELRFKRQTPLQSTSFEITGIKNATYQAEQICQSEHPIRAVKGVQKI